MKEEGERAMGTREGGGCRSREVPMKRAFVITVVCLFLNLHLYLNPVNFDELMWTAFFLEESSRRRACLVQIVSLPQVLRCVLMSHVGTFGRICGIWSLMLIHASSRLNAT